mmetsp:Transcript_8005/g.17226  ORF Transcript_8005/g.17226 Transcript_8005/m.17226 type:complete len:141 (+) Transcript_8005:205-627(+)
MSGLDTPISTSKCTPQLKLPWRLAELLSSSSSSSSTRNQQSKYSSINNKPILFNLVLDDFCGILRDCCCGSYHPEEDEDERMKKKRGERKKNTDTTFLGKVIQCGDDLSTGFGDGSIFCGVSSSTAENSRMRIPSHAYST